MSPSIHPREAVGSWPWSVGRLTAAVCIAVAMVLLMGCGCGVIPKAQKGGSARTGTDKNGAVIHELKQGENAGAPTTQTTERTEKITVPVPAGSVVTTDQHGWTRMGNGTSGTNGTNASRVRAGQANSKNITTTKKADAGQPAGDATASFLTLAGPSLLTIERTERTGTTLGAAQKDSARELGVRIAGMRPVMWFGIACLLGGGVLAYFGWWTKAVIAWVIGGAAILLATILPGHELWFIGGGVAIMVISFPLILHAYNAGRLDPYLPSALDKNPQTAWKDIPYRQPAANSQSPIADSQGGVK